MNYSEEFKKIVDNCVIEGTHIGTGNPNSKILFVGQEAAFTEVTNEYKSNAEEWKKNINDSSRLINNYPVDDSTPYLKKTWGKNTWSKYQKLHDYIFDKENKPYHIDFLENVFTTEMSDNPAKTNIEANKNPNFKSDLQKRKDTFFKENFIKDFNVIVLACSKYIVNNEKNWEINNLFEVEFPGNDFEYVEGLKASKIYSKGNWYFLHLNKEKTKMVIHTRQLSSNVNDDLLKDMGRIIREHLIKNSLL